MITIQRTTASVLLISQLLTSCGGHETILPRSEQASSSSLTATALEKNDTPLTDIDSDITFDTDSDSDFDISFSLRTTKVEGPTLTFDHTPETDLQATFQDHNLSNTTPVQQYSVIQDITLSALSIVVGHYEKKLGKDYADKATADMHAVAQTLPAVASEKEFRAVAVKSECAALWYEYAAQLCLTAKKVWDPQLGLGERPLVILNRLATQQRVNAVIAYIHIRLCNTKI